MPTNSNYSENQQQCVVATLALIRKQSNAYLPIGHSFIPFDILVTVIESFTSNKELTVKALFATLPYSDMGLRYHFRKLLETGWIELHTVAKDARVKQVKPTDKLEKHFESLSHSIFPFLNHSPIDNDN